MSALVRLNVPRAVLDRDLEHHQLQGGRTPLRRSCQVRLSLPDSLSTVRCATVRRARTRWRRRTRGKEDVSCRDADGLGCTIDCPMRDVADRCVHYSTRTCYALLFSFLRDAPAPLGPCCLSIPCAMHRRRTTGLRFGEGGGGGVACGPAQRSSHIRLSPIVRPSPCGELAGAARTPEDDYRKADLHSFCGCMNSDGVQAMGESTRVVGASLWQAEVWKLALLTLCSWFPASQCSIQCRGGTGTHNTRPQIHEARQTENMTAHDHSALLCRQIEVRVH